MSLLATVTAEYKKNSNTANASTMAAYMKNKYSFFGIKTPLRKTLSQNSLQMHGMPVRADWEQICDDFFQAPERELQYFIGDWLRPHWNKLPADFLPQCEKMIISKSWWDTVDWIATRLVGGIVLNNPELKTNIIDHWVNADNIWLQRSALIFQLHFKKETDDARLFTYCEKLAKSDAFFVQKGMGWALRERSKTNPSQTLAFLNKTSLSKLTQREGRKWLIRNGFC